MATKKLLAWFVVAATLGGLSLFNCGEVAQGQVVSSLVPFDYTGGGGIDPSTVLSSFQGFDWRPGNALAKDGNRAIQDFLEGRITPFTLYGQSSLASFLGAGLPADVNEYTVVLACQQVVTGVTLGPIGTSNVSFGLAPVQIENFIKVYHDTTPDANDLAGMGFADFNDTDAKLIMSATVTHLGGAGINMFVSSDSLPFSNLDNYSGPIAPPGNNYPGLTSVSGNGSVTLEGQVNFYDPNYFLTSLLGSSIKLSMTKFPTNVAVPFGQVDPSARFYEGGAEVLDGAGLGAGAVAGLGTTNGLLPIMADGSMGGHGFQFQTDASQTISTVPEPASVILGGLGLVGFLMARLVARRRAP